MQCFILDRMGDQYSSQNCYGLAALNTQMEQQADIKLAHGSKVPIYGHKVSCLT